MKMEQVRIMQGQQNALLQSLQNPYQNLSIGSGGTGICATASTGTAGTLSVGGETLDSGMLYKMKNLIK
jgi:hypothetical protein